MPVSIVVGGQYGSEGKGKVALEMVRRDPSITTVVRPGGTNSGHTAYDRFGRKVILRQFPAAALDGNTSVVFPSGSYIDPTLFFSELRLLGLPRDQVMIDRRAQIILPEHRHLEAEAGLIESIGSTGSGTGASVLSRIARYGAGLPKGIPVDDVSELSSFIQDIPAALEGALEKGDRVLIEGTQGFGLSPFHGESWPKATSRDTIAASFLSETGLAPQTVDEVILVMRAYPIRVAGDSGPLLGETSWEEVSRSSGSPRPLHEYTSVTNKLRRVGTFDPGIVQRAIRANRPTRIVLNHLDHIDASLYESPRLSPAAASFVSFVNAAIGRCITDLGTGPTCIFPVQAGAEALR
jgi:adenylosuccinate synthase